MSNNIYNILGKLKTLTESAEPAAPEATVYETVEPRGSITEAVRSLEGKYAAFKEDKDEYKCILPDGSDDVLFTGTKAECEAWASKGDKDVKIVKEAKKAKPDFLDVDKDGDKAEPFKKAVKDKEAVKEVFSDEEAKAQRDATKDRAWKAKGEANTKKYEKNKKASEKRAQERAAKKNVAEGAFDYEDDNVDYSEFHKAQPENPDTDAVAKRKRLQAIKDRQEDERAERGENKPESNVKIHKGTYGNEYKGDADLDEVAPPGAKAERMVKHIKKGYAKDGKLSKKEKGIAYATAWKAKKAGQVEEGVEFKDAGKIKNSAPNMKKAKPTMVKESRVMEETDYFYEKVAKALAGKNPNLDTAGGDFAAAVRKEMVAQGIEPNRARNILLMDEDFLSDVATSYDHCCKEMQSEGHAPLNSHLGGAEELDEIAALAGLARMAVPAMATSSLTDSEYMDEGMGVTINGNPVDVNSIEIDGVNDWDSPDFADAYITYATFTDGMPLSDEELSQLENEHGDLVNQAAHGSLQDRADFLDEEDMAEGNEFTKARLDAIAQGNDTFTIDGKTYSITGDTSDELRMNESSLNLLRKLSGLKEIVSEKRDIEYVNTPQEQTAPISAVIASGTDMHKSKMQDTKTANKAANPLKRKEKKVDESLWKEYQSIIDDVKSK